MSWFDIKLSPQEYLNFLYTEKYHIGWALKKSWLISADGKWIRIR